MDNDPFILFRRKKLHQEQGQGARVLLGNHKLRAKNKKRDIQVLLLFFFNYS